MKKPLPQNSLDLRKLVVTKKTRQPHQLLTICRILAKQKKKQNALYSLPISQS